MASTKELYREVIAEAMRLWELNALEYRLLPIKYRYLLSIRIYAKKYVPGYGGLSIRRIPEHKLDDYPEIEFLRIVDKVSAREYLEWLSYSEIVAIKHEIDRFCSLCYAKVTMENRVSDFSFWWNHINTPKTALAMSPEACGSGRHTRPQVVIAGTKTKEGT